MTKHETTKTCINWFFTLQTFGDPIIDILLDNRAAEIARYNEQVKKNIYILISCLINAVCFLAKLELAFCRYNEIVDLLNKENHVELLNYTAQYWHQLQQYLQTATVFWGIQYAIEYRMIWFELWVV